MSPSAGTAWTFLSNHAHVILCLAAHPDMRVRDLAVRVGVTERAALRIMADLADAGYLTRQRVGRRTHYVLRLDLPMRHPVEARCSVHALVDAFSSAWSSVPSDAAQ